MTTIRKIILLITFLSIFSSLATYSQDRTFELEVLDEINLLRSNPKSYAENIVEPFSKSYSGLSLNLPDRGILKTREGLKAVRELIRVLKKTQPMKELQFSEGLSLAAMDHVDDQSNTGKTGHTGSDQSNINTRISRHGRWFGRIAENISYGNLTARETVIMLLVDDGIPGRGHRVNFLNPVFGEVGIASGSHPVFENMVVMDFAVSFTANEDLIRIE